MKLNPLWTNREAGEAIFNYGFEKGIEAAQTRRQGKSTGQAFGIIAECLFKPYTKVRIVDHSATAGGNDLLKVYIKTLISHNGLKHFVVTDEYVQFGKE